MSYQYSAFIIRPDAINYTHEIVDMIQGSRVWVMAFTQMRITEGDLKLIYPDVLPEIFEVIREHMLSGPSIVGYVAGVNAIDRLLRVSGLETDPRKCAEETIRWQFGRQLSPRFIQSVKHWYHPNVIHRSRDESEANRDVAMAERYTGCFRVSG